MHGPEAPRALHRLEDNLEAVVCLVKVARREVCLFSPDLEPLPYGRPEFLAEVRGFLLTGTRTRVRILLHHGQAAIRRGHALIPLLRRFSSQAECRRAPGDAAQRHDSLLLVDSRWMAHRPDATMFEGHLIRDPARARAEQLQFDELWQRSDPDPELRRLYL